MAARAAERIAVMVARDAVVAGVRYVRGEVLDLPVTEAARLAWIGVVSYVAPAREYRRRDLQAEA